MKVENFNGKVYDFEVTGTGIEPLSVGEFSVVPPKFFIGKFDSLAGGPTTLHLVFLTDNREECDLVHCWVREAIYYDAEFLSIPNGTYTKNGVEISLPKTLEQSDFELRIGSK